MIRLPEIGLLLFCGFVLLICGLALWDAARRKRP